MNEKFPALARLRPKTFKPSHKNPALSMNNMELLIQWLESYVSDDKVYCLYIAPDEVVIRKHAEQGEFPVTRVAQVRSVIDPTTAE